MASYISSTTTTVADSSTTIYAASTTAGASLLITAMDAPVWVNVIGGTASRSGANCVPIPQNETRRFQLPVNHGGLTAIRDDATSAEVCVAVIGG